MQLKQEHMPLGKQKRGARSRSGDADVLQARAQDSRGFMNRSSVPVTVKSRPEKIVQGLGEHPAEVLLAHLYKHLRGVDEDAGEKSDRLLHGHIPHTHRASPKLIGSRLRNPVYAFAWSFKFFSRR